MAQPTRKIFCLKPLKFVYKVLLYSGLIGFRYNEREKKFKTTHLNHILSQIICRTLLVLHAYLASGYLVIFIYELVQRIEPDTKLSHRETWMDRAIMSSGEIADMATICLFTANYLRRGHCLVPLVNELLDIFNRLAPCTDSWIYFDSNLRLVAITAIWLKVGLTIAELWDEHYLDILRFVVAPYRSLVCLGMSVTCVCFHLVLNCFYMKMNEFLELSCGCKQNYLVLRYLRRFIAISNRMHRVKNQLDWFYSVLLIRFFISVFHDIHCTYAVLLDLKLVVGRRFYMLVVCVVYLPLCLSNSFDVYLIARLSDVLSETEEVFKRRVMQLIYERGLQGHKDLQRAVELMLHQDWLRPIYTLAFGNIHLNRKYAFEFFLTMIVANVITCLQYYVNRT